jgi:hypothetical protein
MKNRKELDRNQVPKPVEIIQATEVDMKKERLFFMCA